MDGHDFATTLTAEGTPLQIWTPHTRKVARAARTPQTRTWKLARFPEQHEGTAQCERNRCANDETPCLKACSTQHTC